MHMMPGPRGPLFLWFPKPMLRRVGASKDGDLSVPTRIPAGSGVPLPYQAGVSTDPDTGAHGCRCPGRGTGAAADRRRDDVTLPNLQ